MINDIIEKVKKGEIQIDTIIGIPSYDGTLMPETQKCVDQLVGYNLHNDIPIALYPAYGSMIAKNRNNILTAAIKAKVKYCLMIDTDMVFPVETLDRLKARKKPIISVKYHAKQHPFSPIMYKRTSNKSWRSILEWKEDVIQVDAIGGGFLLIDVEAIKDLKPPYFAFPTVLQHLMWEKLSELFTDTVAARNPEKIIKEAQKIYDTERYNVDIIGEDCYFSELCRQANIPIFVDTTIKIEHLGTYGFGEQDFFAAVNANIEKMKKQKPKNKIVLAS